MTDVKRIPSIPTEYRGVKFRSRLESRWAIMFDLLGIKWEYEPLELDGYIPDFLLDAEIFSRPQVHGPVLVECRPVIKTEQFRAPIEKIARSGWRGPAMVVGSTLFPVDTPYGVETHVGRGHPAVAPEHANESSYEWFKLGWFSHVRQFGMGGNDLTTIWREAGNRNQWMPNRP